LDKAQEIAEATLKIFPNELGDEEKHVRDTLAHIVEQKAEREWVMAQYFDNKKDYGAARYYYKFLIENYPRTQLADQARSRMDTLRDMNAYPDTPTNHFKWLTRVFDRER
jgi:outer membrane protein assembly factor BamD (BamD/ComL family)